MRWQTWTRFTAIILFVITVLTFAFTYSDNFVEGSSNIEFQNFPTATDLDSLDLNEDIEFSFFLYNNGGEAAFVKKILLSSDLDYFITPEEDFSVLAGEAQEIIVILESPGIELESELYFQVFYDDFSIESEELPVVWGTIL
ncbi:hypothetical protein HN681_04180 [archaeon]|jgi:hypothetical protein|nr:hypothetical protein [archaeon]MBT3731420.1 hypothetical protein [archaeon]MBT4670277.1 hypothetical protein [archaeon]MBT5029705.1 hypothetical protein [archaeon]MBT5287546.1 hypothetical protein [archaeon]